MGRVWRKQLKIFLSIYTHLIRIVIFFDKTSQSSQDIVPEIYDIEKFKLSVGRGYFHAKSSNNYLVSALKFFISRFDFVMF